MFLRTPECQNHNRVSTLLKVSFITTKIADFDFSPVGKSVRMNTFGEGGISAVPFPSSISMLLSVKGVSATWMSKKMCQNLLVKGKIIGLQQSQGGEAIMAL